MRALATRAILVGRLFTFLLQRKRLPLARRKCIQDAVNSKRTALVSHTAKGTSPPCLCGSVVKSRSRIGALGSDGIVEFFKGAAS